MADFIATVSAIVDTDENGNPATARVLPHTAGGVVTAPFAVYWPMRSGPGAIKAGDKVVCLQFEDGSGLVLCRTDGTWTQSIGGAVTGGDFIAGGRSLASHSH